MAIVRARPSLPGDLARQIDRFSLRSRATTRRGLQKIARVFKRRMISERLSGRPGLNRITGETARSLRAVVTGTAPSVLRLAVRIGGRRTPGVRAHEFGAVIRPRTKPWLAIPLGPSRGGRAAREQVDFWITNDKGNIVGMKKTGPDSVRPVVVLVKSVTIPPRLSFLRIFSAEVRSGLREIRVNLRKGGF